MHPHRGILIAGNWKMNSGIQETQRFLNALNEHSSSLQNLSPLLRACLFPPYLSLSEARRMTQEKDLPLFIGAQNAHWEKKGAFTGEISGPMLMESGISWVLLGHSERRQFFGETNEGVKKRALSLLDQGFHVILCIGETLSEREAGLTEKVLHQQIEQGVPQIQEREDLAGELILAYEPVWAIGTGKTASIEQAQSAHAWIRQVLNAHLGQKRAESTSILYGGSVTPENLTSLLQCEDIDGALVGGASLKPDSYWKLIQQAQDIAGK